MWAGTYSGRIVVYEQDRFRSFGIAEGFPERAVLALHEDGHGRTWIGTDAGLFVLRRGRVSPFAPELAGEAARIRVIAESRDGTIWLGTRAGLFRVDGARAAAVEEVPASATGGVQALFEARNGSLWIGGERGAFEWRRAGAGLRAVTGMAGTAIHALHESADGVMWLGTPHGLGRVEGDAVFTLTARHGLTNGTVHRILEDSAGELWLTSHDGVLRAARREMDDVGAPRALRRPERPLRARVRLCEQRVPGRLAAGRQPDWRRSSGCRRLTAWCGSIRAPCRAIATPPPIVIEDVIVDHERRPVSPDSLAPGRHQAPRPPLHGAQLPRPGARAHRVQARGRGPVLGACRQQARGRVHRTSGPARIASASARRTARAWSTRP